MVSFSHAINHLDRFIRDRMRGGRAPGIAIALTDRDQLIHRAAYGVADLATGAAVMPETLFQIGSITKTVTAVAVLQQCEAGRLNLHAPAQRYLPWFHVPSRYGEITLHHLLSHTAGLVGCLDVAPTSRFEVWALRETETGFPPGSHFHYSDAGYQALGYLLEELLGMSYGEVVQRQILDPLGMTATDPVITHVSYGRLAVGYQPFPDDRPPDHRLPLRPAPSLEYGGADASIASTAADMAAFVRFMLNRGATSDGYLLAPMSFDLMTRPVAPGGEGAAYGYGLGMRALDGRQLIGHDGGMIGYRSSVLADVEAGLGVVVLMNGLGDPSAIAEFALKVLHAAARDAAPPVPPPVHDPFQITNAVEYAGRYTMETKALDVAADGERLILDHDGTAIALERRAPDTFYVAHPDFALYLLRFGRDGETVAEAGHGADWYTNDRYRGPTSFEHPPAWLTFTGHYRSHNPWHPGFRVVLRKGVLRLVEASGAEESLVPLGDSQFRVGDDDASPERVRFDTLIGGHTQRAVLSGASYYRFFVP